MTTTQSENLNELFTALSAAQVDYADVVKDRKVDIGKYKYMYADLADMIRATKFALAKNGLVVVQTVCGVESALTVTTTVGHASGQYIRDSWEFSTNGLSMQAIGGLITYARRYSYSAVLGIAADVDDDANEATRMQSTRTVIAPPTKAPAPAAPARPAVGNSTHNRVNECIVLRNQLRNQLAATDNGNTMSAQVKADFVANLATLVRNINTELGARQMQTMTHFEKAAEMWTACNFAIDMLIDHDRNNNHAQVIDPASVA